MRRLDNGLYLGKFDTKQEYIDFRKEFIKEYRKRDIDLKNLVKEVNEREGTQLHYMSARHWLAKRGIKIGKNRTPSTLKAVRFDKKTAQEFANYSEALTFKAMAENGLRLLFGHEGNDMVVIYYPEGVVIFQWQKNRTVAVCTADFKDSQLKTIQGIAELAYQNGQDWLISFAQSSGLPVFPPYTTEQRE